MMGQRWPRLIANNNCCCVASFLFLLLSLLQPEQTHSHGASQGIFLPHDAVLPTQTVNYGANHPFEIRRRLQNYDDDGFDRSKIDYDFETTGHEPIRIRFITTLLEERRGESDEMDRHIDILLTETLAEVAAAWALHLQVYPAQEPIPLGKDVCFWNFEDLDDDLFEDGVSDADLVILVAAEDRLYPPGGGEDKVRVCRSSKQIALALSCVLDQWDRPIVGIINFCLPLGVDEPNDEEQTKANIHTVAMHEIVHVLGMDPFLFRFFRDPETGEPLTARGDDNDEKFKEVTCVDGNTITIPFPSDNTIRRHDTADDMVYYEIVTPTVATVVRNHFNCQSLEGARLENQATAGVCIGDHWDERLFYTELLGQRFTGRSDFLSPLTLALLADTGWYPHVSFQHSEASPFGKGLGCDFVNSDCIVDGEIPSWGKDVFCDRLWDLDDPTSQAMCDPTHSSFATCNLVDLDDEDELADIDEEVPDESEAILYFSDLNLVGLLAETEYCPMPIGNLGTDCTAQDETYVGSYVGEEVGSNSRCIHAIEEDAIRTPICMRVTCSQAGKVIVGSGQFQQTCEYDGQRLETINSEGLVIECPRFATVCSHMVCPFDCSGAGICNYETMPPSCECFDSDDTSIGCSGDATTAPQPSPAGPVAPSSPAGPTGPSSPVSTGARLTVSPSSPAPMSAAPTVEPSSETSLVGTLTHETGSFSTQQTDAPIGSSNSGRMRPSWWRESIIFLALALLSL